MEFEWEKVKEWTLWHYEDLIKRISKVFEYDFVIENYNMTLNAAKVYTEGLLNFGEGKYDTYSEEIITTLQSLEKQGVKDYIKLVEEVETREKCEALVNRTKVPFRELIRLLSHIFRWVLPFTAPIKEFLDRDDDNHMSYATKLREIGVRNNLDILDKGRSQDERKMISTKTGISEDFLLDLVNKADISRIPYVRGKTVKIFCNAGYDKLQKIAETSTDVFVTDLKEYLQTVGIKFSKSFIEPDGAIAQARVLPPLVDQ